MDQPCPDRAAECCRQQTRGHTRCLVLGRPVQLSPHNCYERMLEASLAADGGHPQAAVDRLCRRTGNP